MSAAEGHPRKRPQVRARRKSPRPIPGANCIKAYFHCSRCIAELPDGISPKDWSRVQIGFTPLGIQVWCNRHDINVCHIDFEGQKHPANVGEGGTA